MIGFFTYALGIGVYESNIQIFRNILDLLLRLNNQLSDLI